jgi:hypothetical protein
MGAYNGDLSSLLVDGSDRMLIGGMFRPNGAGAVDNTLNKYIGRATQWTAARTSAGLFTISLGFKFPRVLYLPDPSLILAAGDDKFAQWDGDALDSFEQVDSLVLRVWDISGAAETDVASGAGNWISWAALVALTGVARP